MFLQDFFDYLGNLHVGSFTRSSRARMTVDFDADDTGGIALDVAPTRAGAGRKAGIKLGGYTLTQDLLGDGTLNFGILDSTGAVVINFSAAQLVAKFNLAVNTPANVHQDIDTTLVSTAALSETVAVGAPAIAAKLALVVARANALKAWAATHIASLGTSAVDGYHLALSATSGDTLAAIPAATNEATSITLATGLFTWLGAHADEAGAHFHDDTVANAATVTDSTPADMEATCVCLNELLVLFKAHAARGISAT